MESPGIEFGFFGFAYIPARAYSSGSLGTAIGADVLHLGTIQALSAAVASIGGAGSFDGSS